MRKAKLIILGGLTAAIPVIIAVFWDTGDNSLRTYFDIPRWVSLNQSEIRSAVLRKIPLGTPEPLVRQEVNQLGIGSNRWSGYYNTDYSRKAKIRIESDPNAFQITARSYDIYLIYDSKMKLCDVSVDICLTRL